jgi:excisionase family DNA binding protein
MEEKEFEKEYLTAEELAKKFDMSKKFIEKHIGTRRLPGMCRIGRRWRFRSADVEKRLLSGELLLPENGNKKTYQFKGWK